MVLDSIWCQHIPIDERHGTSIDKRRFTLYDSDIYSNASVRFLVTKNALANLSNLASVSLSVGGGDMASHGGGVTTAVPKETLLGGSSTEVPRFNVGLAKTSIGARSNVERTRPRMMIEEERGD
jgi:hypothetical protein